MVWLTSTHKAQAYTQQRRNQWFKFIRCKKVKCAIKFVRALITSFLITSLIWKVDKNMNILRMHMLVGRYGGLFGITWFRELDA